MNLTIFNSAEFGQVRVTTEDGRPLFCAKDIAVALGYSRPRDAVSDHCKGGVVLALPSAGGPQNTSPPASVTARELGFGSITPAAFEAALIELRFITRREALNALNDGAVIYAHHAITGAVSRVVDQEHHRGRLKHPDRYPDRWVYTQDAEGDLHVAGHLAHL